MRKKMEIVSVLLCLIMLICMMPTKAFAENQIITHANITITKPVGGENPDFNPVSSEPDKYYADVDRWSWMFGGTVTPVGGGSTFKKHERYDLRVIFHAKHGYTFAEDCVFTINGEETGCYGLNANEFRYTYLYAADPACPTYTVYFNANGGSGTMANVTDVFDKYELPLCTYTAPAGQFFDGWLVGGYLEDPGDIIHILENTTLRAAWKDIPAPGEGYKVTFDANGGTGTMAGKSDFYGMYTLPECGFTAPSGQRFECWFLPRIGVSKNPGEKINITLNENIIAIWEDIPEIDNKIYTVRASITEPVGGATSTAGIIQSNNKYNVSIGWSTTADGSTLNDFNNKNFVAGKTYYADIYLTAQSPFVFAEGATVFVNDVAYTAVWAVGSSYKEYIAVYDVPFTVPNQTYTVSFNTNGGTGNMADVKGVFGNYKLPSCSFVAPAGKQFKCWAVDSASGTQYNVGEEYNVSGNVCFYPVWKSAPVSEVTITATAGANGSVSPSGTIKIAKGSAQTFTITANSGYHIQDVKVNGKSVGKVSTYTFKNVTSDATISAEFAVDTSPHVCKPSLVAKEEPDCYRIGKSEYYHCECGKNYEDENAKKIIPNIESWGILKALEHSTSTSWLMNDNSHWKECIRCEERLENSVHNEGKCDICGYKMFVQEVESEQENETTEDSTSSTNESIDSTEVTTESTTDVTEDATKEILEDNTKPDDSETTLESTTNVNIEQKNDGDNDNHIVIKIIIVVVIIVIVGGVVSFIIIKKKGQ